jgi:hypothetical protein
MDLVVQLLKGHAIERQALGGIFGVGPGADRLDEFRNGQRIDPRTQSSGVERRVVVLYVVGKEGGIQP